MIYIELETLSDGPFGRIVPGCCQDYYRIVDYADSLEWYWSGLSSPENERHKRSWWEQYALTRRNPLVITDDARPLAAGNLFISRDLNLCRLWAKSGGRSTWIDNGVWRDASGDDRQWLAREALGVLPRC